MLALLQNLLAQYGYLAIAVGVLLESMGVPLPGETLLLLGAAYAGAGHLRVWGVILAAALGALVGDTLGYTIGRRGGRALLERYGRVFHLNPARLARAEAFFARYGDIAVLIGRFVALLRAFSALLAGINRMPYRRFLLFNALGGVLWAVTFGLLGAAFGSQWILIARWAKQAGLLLVGLLTLGIALVLLYRWALRHEQRLRALWQGPRATALRRRFAPQLAWFAARISPAGVFGLHLTIALGVLVAAGWLLGSITEDVIHHDPLVQVDRAVSHWLHAHVVPPLTLAMLLLSLAGPPLVVVLSPLLGALLWWQRRWDELALLVVTIGGGALLNRLLKLLVARQRPAFPDPLLVLRTASFPSAHAMDSLLFYGLLAYLLVPRCTSWRARVLVVLTAATLILLIGFSRIYLGVHYLSDVLAGYAAGIVWLTATTTGLALLRALHNRSRDSAAHGVNNHLEA